MNCYFCKTDLIEENFLYIGSNSTEYQCFSCNEVFMAFDTYSQKLLNIDFYYGKIGNPYYRINLDFVDNCTLIYYIDKNLQGKILLKIQGTSLNPSNVENKLKTYLMLL